MKKNNSCELRLSFLELSTGNGKPLPEPLTHQLSSWCLFRSWRPLSWLFCVCLSVRQVCCRDAVLDHPPTPTPPPTIILACLGPEPCFCFRFLFVALHLLFAGARPPVLSQERIRRKKNSWKCSMSEKYLHFPLKLDALAEYSVSLGNSKLVFLSSGFQKPYLLPSTYFYIFKK